MTDTPEIPVEEVDDYTRPGVWAAQPRKTYKTNYDSDRPPFSAIWLISFTDLMGIVLTFFVLLYTISGHTKDKEQTPQQDEAIIREMNKFAGDTGQAGHKDAISLNKIDFNQSLDLGYIKSVLDDMTASTPILQKVRVVNDEQNKRLILTLPHDLLFEKGEADLTADGQKAVQAITAVLKNIRNGIEIAGHADPVQPGKNGPTNWDLSLSRALDVAGVMSTAGYTRSLPVKGYSSGLYESLPKTMTEDERQALSRRVDIIVNFHDGKFQQRFGIAER